MNTNILEQYLAATKASYTYTRNYDRWNFLLESYMGGDEYRRAGHLTRYALETDQEYNQRLANTPLDNHCQSVISVYTSFLFRSEPQRDLGVLDSWWARDDFLQDTDMEGRDINALMREAAVWSSVFGHCFLLVTKPTVLALTLQDEVMMGMRPYVSILTPLVVYDWQYQRTAAGRYDLVYIKYAEDINDSVTVIREWYPNSIKTSVTDRKHKTVIEESEEINGLGYIPIITAYSRRSPIRGLGISAISDIADQQRAIYNELSEVEQSIRLDGHPSLVVTSEVKVGSGAGAIILMPDNQDPGTKPYVLDYSGAEVSAIYQSIENRVKMIDKMANTGAVRGTETREASGIAQEVEFQLLNAKLSEMADNLELAEEQLWRIVSDYIQTPWTGLIKYPDSFAIRDTQNEFGQLQIAKSTATAPKVLAVIDQQLLELLGADTDAVSDQEINHSPTTPETQDSHIQEMIMQGYTDQDILTLHAELTQQDIDTARNNI